MGETLPTFHCLIECKDAGFFTFSEVAQNYINESISIYCMNGKFCSQYLKSIYFNSSGYNIEHHVPKKHFYGVILEKKIFMFWRYNIYFYVPKVHMFSVRGYLLRRSRFAFCLQRTFLCEKGGKSKRNSGPPRVSIRYPLFATILLLHFQSQRSPACML